MIGASEKAAFTMAHGDGLLDVLGCPFGGPHNGKDTDGEWFSEKTEFLENSIMYPPVFYYHGSVNDATAKLVGKIVSRWRDTKGVWYRVKLALDSNDKAFSPSIARMLWEKAKEGVLYASSGAVRASMVKSANGHIDQWLVGELSLIDASDEDDRIPANSYAIATPTVESYVKSNARSGQRLFGNTYIRKGNKTYNGTMNLSSVLSEIDNASFALVDWFNMSSSVGNLPDDESVQNGVAEVIRDVLSINPQVVPSGETVDSVTNSLMSSYDSNSINIEDATSVINTVTSMLSRIVPALTPNDEEGNDMEAEQLELKEDVQESVEAPTETTESDSIKSASDLVGDDVVTEETSSESERTEGAAESFEDVFIKAMENPLVREAFAKMANAENLQTSDTKSAEVASDLYPVDAELLSTLVDSGLMTADDRTSLEPLFVEVRANASEKSGASKTADALRALVKRAYTVQNATVVSASGDNPAATSNGSDALSRMKEYIN